MQIRKNKITVTFFDRRFNEREMESIICIFRDNGFQMVSNRTERKSSRDVIYRLICIWLTKPNKDWCYIMNKSILFNPHYGVVNDSDIIGFRIKPFSRRDEYEKYTILSRSIILLLRLHILERCTKEEQHMLAFSLEEVFRQYPAEITFSNSDFVGDELLEMLNKNACAVRADRYGSSMVIRNYGEEKQSGDKQSVGGSPTDSCD